jgi:6-phosphogluconolactonase
VDIPNAVRTLDYGIRGKVHTFPDADSLAMAAATTAVTVLEGAQRRNGAAYVALSGGTTPDLMGKVLAQPRFRNLPLWKSLAVFWGDERWVPISDDESNAGTAKGIFLDEISIPPEHIHPMPTHAGHPQIAAASYAELIRSIVPAPDGIPQFDLVFLGLGTDGHTASLFPETSALTNDEALVVANNVPKLETTRLTMTAPLLNEGRQVVFLVGGESKAAVLRDVLEGPEIPMTLPAQLIRPRVGALTWLVDDAAAALLSAT